MSALNSLFNRASFGVRCKTCLNLALSRIKLLRNKRELQLNNMRREISHFLQTGQEAIARIRVEHVIREENILAAYEILELFCEFVLARVPIIETQRDCPSELREAIASIIFASPRCSDLPELMQIRNLFTAKYGKEFVLAASELRPDSGVNRTIIEKLSVRAPPAISKLKVLKAIAQEYNLVWNSSNTEAEFSKEHEDLLEGSNPLNSRENSEAIVSSSIKTTTKGSPKTSQLPQPRTIPTTATNKPSDSAPDCEQSKGVATAATNQSSDDVLEKARAAIASADRASVAARSAAELMKVRFFHQASNAKSCD